MVVKQMSLSNSLLIGIQDLEGRIDHSKPLEEKLYDAMVLSLDSWLITDEDEQHKIAIGAVLSKGTEEERKLINEELEGLQGVFGAPSGMPMDPNYLFTMLGQCKLGLQNIWDKAKKSKEKQAEAKGGFVL